VVQASDRSEVPVLGCLFASGFLGLLGNPEFDNVNRTFVCREFDWEKVRKNMGAVVLYHGEDNPYVPTSKCVELAGKLNTEPKIVKEGGT